MYLNSPILVAAAKGQVELTEGMEGSSNNQMYSRGRRKRYILNKKLTTVLTLLRSKIIDTLLQGFEMFCAKLCSIFETFILTEKDDPP